MTDEEVEEEDEEEAPRADLDGPAASPDSPVGRSPRAPPAVLRAIVVLAVAGIVYQVVVPRTDVVTSRLSRLAIHKTAVKPFDIRPTGAGVQSVGQTGIAALQTAAKKSPSRTGLYSVEWSPSQTTGAGVILFLLPTDVQARAVLSQITAQQLSKNAYSASSLTRRSTFPLEAIPGSSAALFTPSTSAAPHAPSLAVGAFAYGRVVAVSEALESANSVNAMKALAAQERGLLAKVEPGFSMEVVRHPVVASILWILGAVVLAALAALAPFISRKLADRRDRRRRAELQRRVVVRGQVITKRRL